MVIGSSSIDHRRVFMNTNTYHYAQERLSVFLSKITQLIFFFAVAGISLYSLPVKADCDNRIAITNPDRFPFKTIATLRYDPDDDGVLGSWGSSALVGPHMALTCGHCVWYGPGDRKVLAPIHVQPAAHLDESSGDIVLPHGYRVVTDEKYKRINNKYPEEIRKKRAGESYDSMSVDYGALYLVCPFEDIDTYMPMAFDLEVGYINMSGYPIEDLPSTSHNGDQWRVSGSVANIWDRKLKYNATSTGGASGSPVWYYDPNSEEERRIIAVNTTHWTSCDGGGPRLVWNNEDLITNTWLRWEPSMSEKIEAGCAFEIMTVPWETLYDYTLKGPLLHVSKLRLISAPKKIEPGRKASRRIYQYIKNSLFVWEEYYVNPRDPSRSKRYLRLLEPEEKWLSVKEAQVLLTASSKWANLQETGGKYRETISVGELVPLAQEVAGDHVSKEAGEWIEGDFDQMRPQDGPVGRLRLKGVSDEGVGADQ